MHHRKFGILPARRAPDINARVRKNLPESVDPLNAKLRLRCAEVVKVRDLLWKGLEIEVEIQNVNREGRKAKRKALLFVAPF
ncbi:MAG: hypothetical protein LAN64_02495 [Acidobacteriia bacterium]|nr:hypothetical protein [Terriglobia bacterium]